MLPRSWLLTLTKRHGGRAKEILAGHATRSVCCTLRILNACLDVVVEDVIRVLIDDVQLLPHALELVLETLDLVDVCSGNSVFKGTLQLLVFHDDFYFTKAVLDSIMPVKNLRCVLIKRGEAFFVINNVTLMVLYLSLETFNGCCKC